MTERDTLEIKSIGCMSAAGAWMAVTHLTGSMMMALLACLYLSLAAIYGFGSMKAKGKTDAK